MIHIITKKNPAAFSRNYREAQRYTVTAVLVDDFNKCKTVPANNFWKHVGQKTLVYKDLDSLITKIAEVMAQKFRYNPTMAVGWFGNVAIVSVIPSNPDSNRHIWVFFESEEQAIGYELRHLQY